MKRLNKYNKFPFLAPILCQDGYLSAQAVRAELDAACALRRMQQQQLLKDQDWTGSPGGMSFKADSFVVWSFQVGCNFRDRRLVASSPIR